MSAWWLAGTEVSDFVSCVVLRVESLLQSSFWEKQKRILIVKVLQKTWTVLLFLAICKIRAIILVLITNAELLSLVYFLWIFSLIYITIFLSCLHLQGDSLVTGVFWGSPSDLPQVVIFCSLKASSVSKDTLLYRVGLSVCAQVTFDKCPNTNILYSQILWNVYSRTFL